MNKLYINNLRNGFVDKEEKFSLLVRARILFYDL